MKGGTHRRETNHDRSTVRRSLQGPDPADTDAGGVREPSRLVGIGAGYRGEPEPKADGAPYVIPDEMRASVMDALGLELGLHAWGLLLNALTFSQLKQTLIKKKLPSSGTKSELKGRVISSGLSPSRVLGILPELARRDRENLLANQIIGKDIDIERGFEAATRFLFESRLGLKLMEMTGSEHPDGCIRFGGRRKAGGDVLMWDNKSTETAYTFPPSHLRQFKRYIRDSRDPVACFLVVVADADDSAMDRVWQLAADCAGTNVAVIAAENLGWVAEEWWGRGVDGGFNLEVLNMTGILSRPLLEQRMRLFL